MAQNGRDEKGLFVTGNDFAAGAAGSGKPPIFSTPLELAEKVADYFNNVAYRTKAKLKPTVCGLAFHLGFKSRQSLYDYKAKEEFGFVIERAMLKIEEAHELNLFEFASRGSEYWLNNHGWETKTSQKIDQKIDADVKEVWDVTLNLKGQ